MEKAQTESHLSITSNDINIELSNEFLKELQVNAYHGWIDEDVINHIAMVLKMIDSIYIRGVDSHQLQMKIFHLSLVDEAKQWWINEGDGKITIWEEFIEKFFCKFYLESYDGEDEMLDEGDNWGIDPLEFISQVNSSFDKHMKWMEELRNTPNDPSTEIYKNGGVTLSLDELRSPDFNLFSDQEYSEEEEAEAMAETIEQYMSKTRTDYGSGVARPKIEERIVLN
ncbi:hypothetical protein Tco_0779267 [Tanacetum coccineum]